MIGPQGRHWQQQLLMQWAQSNALEALPEKKRAQAKPLSATATNSMGPSHGTSHTSCKLIQPKRCRWQWQLQIQWAHSNTSEAHNKGPKRSHQQWQQLKMQWAHPRVWAALSEK